MAKEQKQEQDTPSVPEVPEVVGPPKSYRLYIMLGFFCLILFQTIVLGVLVSLLAKQPLPEIGIDPRNGVPNFEDVPNVPSSPITKDPTIEKPIGDRATFKIRTPRGEFTDTFNLVMHVTVRKTDERAFNTRYEQCTIAVIDRATSVLSASTTEERAEASRTAIKERVKRAINEVLETPWVQEVFFTEVTHEIN